MAAVTIRSDLETKKIKSVTASTFSSSICHEVALTVPSHYLLNPVSKLFVFSSKEKTSFNFMATVTIYSDFGVPPKKSVTVSLVSLSIWCEGMGEDAMIFIL